MATKPSFQQTFQTHFINLLMTPCFGQQLNGMSQNGKCLVDVPCDRWYVVLPGAVESVEGL
jgi:hypothetical protein